MQYTGRRDGYWASQYRGQCYMGNTLWWCLVLGGWVGDNAPLQWQCAQMPILVHYNAMPEMQQGNAVCTNITIEMQCETCIDAFSNAKQWIVWQYASNYWLVSILWSCQSIFWNSIHLSFTKLSCLPHSYLFILLLLLSPTSPCYNSYSQRQLQYHSNWKCNSYISWSIVTSSGKLSTKASDIDDLWWPPHGQITKHCLKFYLTNLVSHLIRTKSDFMSDVR